MVGHTHGVLASYGGGFLPSNIGGMIGWYRADQGVTIATGVSQWNDLSGNGRHLTQATGANQPTFGATSGPNSTPALTFDGTNDSLGATFTAINQPFHTFVIIRTTSLATGNGGMICGGSIGERILVVGTPNTNTFTYFGGTGITYSHTDTTNHYLWEVLCNTTSSTVIRGNTSQLLGGIGSNTLSGISLGLLVGNASYGAMVLSEVVIYSAPVTGTNLTNLRAYFAARYGVTTT